jgi:acyl transferase domain-containing protein
MAEPEGTTGLEIAVIGMSGRFPGAAGIDEFWENLKNSVELIYFLNEKELEDAGVDAEQLKNPHYVKAVGGVLEETEYFDAAFFDYVPNEAIVMNPQLRLFHEYSWQALENAGYDPHSYTKKIGLYAGASSSFNWETLTALSGKAGDVGLFAAATLASTNSLATRVSYKLNLKGPAVTVQTACSTSLTAIVLACQGILTGQCNMALAGGVSISTGKKKGYIYKEGMIRSPDGHCRAFASEAKGMIAGEGIGIVLLKLLEDAIEEGDTIHALIKGSAVNNDGNRKVGYTAPSIDGQVEVIRAAHLMAEIEPESITYVETHGTGTSLGDPVEIEALKQAFNTDKKGFCAIGSVKTNIGHLDAAAGVAGFIKTVLALKHRQIPPSLHFENPNPKINIQNSPFCVNNTLTEWKNSKYPLRAGISSFGIGGTNAHLVLEEAPGSGRGRVSPPPPQRDYQLIALSAKSETALEKITENLVKFLGKNPGTNLADASYTLQLGRKAFRFRKILLCSSDSPDEAIREFSSPGTGNVLSFLAAEKQPSAVFMFPGQGSQYVNMGRELYQKEPLFREELDRCFEILKPIMANDIKVILYPYNRSNRSYSSYNSHQSPIDQTEIAQPLLFAIEYALAKLLIKWGIKPYAMVGHSIGEYVAAHLAGVFSLTDALEIVAYRGKLMGQMKQGAMLSAAVPEDQLQPLLKQISGSKLSLAAVNGPANCTVSGPNQDIEAFERYLQDNGYQCRRLHTSHAFHSAMMDPMVKAFEEKAGTVTLNKPTVPYISNTTGTWITARDAVDPRYWRKHLRETVRFSAGIKELLKREHSLFIEVGPGQVLTTFLKAHHPDHNNSLSVNLLRHPREEAADTWFLYQKIAQMWLYGKDIHWQVFHEGEQRHRIPLPTYPFERQRYWIDESGINNEKFFSKSAPPGRRRQEPLADWFYLPNWKREIKVLNKNTPHETEKRKWLIFIDQYGLGGLLAKGLQDQGHEVLTVAAGPGFTNPGKNQYFINPRQPGDYRQLFNHINRHRDLAVPGDHSLDILHLWTLTGNGPNETGFEQMQTLGFYSLLHIARTSGEKAPNIPGKIRLTVISDHFQDVSGEELLVPAKSTMLGPLAVIPQEHTHIRCRSIDIVWPAPGTDAQDSLVNQLLAEVDDNDETWETAAAFRGPHRLVRCFEPLHLEEVEPGHLPLREKGVYLITGGTGNIGLTLAEYLAKEFNARLILTGRTPVSSKSDIEENEKTGKIKRLQAMGAEVLTFSCDVGDEPGMKAVISAAEQRWGRIHGVIHSAGLISGSTFDLADNLDPDICRQQFQAKVFGTLVLEKLFREKSLDFCWLMSSVSTVLGGLQFSAYAAANAFMDALACRLKHNNQGHWLSLDWDGMSEGNTIEACKRILSLLNANGNINRLVVSTGGNLQARIDRWIKLKSRQEEIIAPGETKTPLHPRPQLFTPYAEPYNEVQKSLVTIWQKVFGYEQIGIRDEFLELGGDSLKAITLISMILKTLEIKVSLAELFRLQTIEKIARFIQDVEKERVNPIQPVEKQEQYELSFHQQRLWVIYNKEPDTSAYNIPVIITLNSPIEPAVLKESLRDLAARHESLRTGIKLKAGRPVQFIKEQVTVPLKEVDISHLEVEEIEPQQRKIRSAEILAPFDLSNPPLFRVLLLKWGETGWDLVLSVHHIISDGWSQEILKRDLMVCYQALQAQKAIQWDPLPLQYKDFASWQNKQIHHRDLKENSHQYWKQKLTGGLPVVDLPADFPGSQDIKGAGYTCMIGAGLKERLQQTAKQHNTTLFMMMFSAFLLLLSDFSQQEDIACSIIEAGRNEVDFQQVVGFFVNSIPFKTRVKAGESFTDLLCRINHEVLEAFQHGSYPVEYVFEELGMNYPPLPASFNMLSMQQFTGEIPLQPFEPIHIPHTQDVKFDIEPYITEYSSGIELKWVYRKSSFAPETIGHIASEYLKICEYFVQNPGMNMKDFHRSAKKRHFKKSTSSSIPRGNGTDNNPKGRFQKEIQ